MIIEKFSSDIQPYQLCSRAVEKNFTDIVFLDSNDENPEMSRYSLLFVKPFKKTILYSFGLLKNELANFLSGYDGTDVPVGAAAGYVSYDAGLSIEGISSGAVDELNWPMIELGLFDAYIVYDCFERKYFLISTGLPEKTYLARKKRAKKRLEMLKNILGTSNLRLPASGLRLPAYDLRFNFNRPSYYSSINRIKKYIEAGDVYQVNLSQRFYARPQKKLSNCEVYQLYLRIRQNNRVPYGAFINFNGRQILSFSMERFLKMRGLEVETRPIKGTIERGHTPQQDKQNIKKLLKSKKNIAELLMITDLERNDLGRSCEYGSVRVKQLHKIEKYSSVFHLVSTIAGTLHKGVNHIDCFRKCFPGGSITGAPKIRSMEIIDELEKVRRNVYCGSIGYFGFNAVSDFNIAIRTIMVNNNELIFNSGGGITYDSNPSEEYDETLHKVRTFLDVIGK